MHTMTELYLNPAQVIEMVKQAEREEEIIVIRCRRKCPASKPGGPDAGELHDLHCGTKPPYKAVGSMRDRADEDRNCGVLTVWATNRRDPKTGQWGAWRRVNVEQVVKVICRGSEYLPGH